MCMAQEARALARGNEATSCLLNSSLWPQSAANSDLETGGSGSESQLWHFSCGTLEGDFWSSVFLLYKIGVKYQGPRFVTQRLGFASAAAKLSSN